MAARGTPEISYFKNGAGGYGISKYLNLSTMARAVRPAMYDDLTSDRGFVDFIFIRPSGKESSNLGFKNSGYAIFFKHPLPTIYFYILWVCYDLITKVGLSEGARLTEYLEFLKSRRSIRRFKQTKPPMELIMRAIDTARYAPSARNSQPWRFVIIEDEVVKDRLSSIHPAATPLRGAPIGIVVVCHIDESPTSYALDCANATLYLLLALHALGLGAVWIQALRNIDEIKQILYIPDNAIPVAIIAVGYPEESPQPRPRKPVDEIVYLNKYGVRISSG